MVVGVAASTRSIASCASTMPLSSLLVAASGPLRSSSSRSSGSCVRRGLSLEPLVEVGDPAGEDRPHQAGRLARGRALERAADRVLDRLVGDLLGVVAVAHLGQGLADQVLAAAPDEAPERRARLVEARGRARRDQVGDQRLVGKRAELVLGQWLEGHRSDSPAGVRGRTPLGCLPATRTRRNIPASQSPVAGHQRKLRHRRDRVVVPIYGWSRRIAPVSDTGPIVRFEGRRATRLACPP